MYNFFIKGVAWYLVVAMCIIGIVPKSEAGFLPSAVVPLSSIDGASDLAKIQKILERKMISDRLEKYGLAQNEINTRMARLTDQQVHDLSLNLDQLQVGGNALGLILVIFAIMGMLGFLLYLIEENVVVK